MVNKLKVKVHTSFIGKTGYNYHSRNFFTELSKTIDLKIRNFTVGDKWVGLSDDPHKDEDYLSSYQKKLICQQTLINNKGELYDSDVYDGDFDDYDIDIVLNETEHHYFYNFDKFKGKFKIAYNVWESTLQPTNFFKQLMKFDQLWVPTEWQRQCSIKQGFPQEKVFVVPEAVNGDIFYPDNKKTLIEHNDNRFKFIIFGRWDYRKSTEELIDTFLKTFDKSEPVDIIVSVENKYAKDEMKSTEERLEKYGLLDNRIKILNFLDREEYINYIKSGHIFLSCARSEGWNLPLIESLACGVPSIYSDWGAQLEFANGKGHPVKIIDERPISKDAVFITNTPGYYCEPDFKDLSKVMRDVYTNYWEYKVKAIKDSELIRNEFSWENASIKAKKILEKLYNETNKK